MFYDTCGRRYSPIVLDQGEHSDIDVRDSFHQTHWRVSERRRRSARGVFSRRRSLVSGHRIGSKHLQQSNAVQREHGVDVALLSRDELAVRFPWLNLSDLAGGSLGLRNEGWFDPYALLQGFKRKARSLGVTYVGDEVEDMKRKDARISGVRLKRSGAVHCGIVVNAAGPRARPRLLKWRAWNFA